MGLYRVQFAFESLDDYETGSSQIFGGFTEVENFEVPGGSRRSFWSNRKILLEDADMMAEFYQAKHFQKLLIQKLINRASLSIDRIYYRILKFKFSFVVVSLSKSSRFRSLSLSAEDGRIPDRILRNSHSEAFIITFSAPQIDYYYNEAGGKGVVKESL